jgi:hypothetical protein
VEGSLAHPGPFNSYVIIENNWGKNAGYHSFYFMNFTAFRYLAYGLQTYRLDAQCWSEACEWRPPVFIPSTTLTRILFPPDPQGPAFQFYEGVFRAFVPLLSGRPPFSGKPPVIPGSFPTSRSSRTVPASSSSVEKRALATRRPNVRVRFGLRETGAKQTWSELLVFRLISGAICERVHSLSPLP